MINWKIRNPVLNSKSPIIHRKIFKEELDRFKAMTTTSRMSWKLIGERIWSKRKAGCFKMPTRAKGIRHLWNNKAFRINYGSHRRAKRQPLLEMILIIIQLGEIIINQILVWISAEEIWKIRPMKRLWRGLPPPWVRVKVEFQAGHMVEGTSPLKPICQISGSKKSRREILHSSSLTRISSSKVMVPEANLRIGLGQLQPADMVNR